MERGAAAAIDLKAIGRNLGTVRKIAGNRAVIAVVKADAYGHGAPEVASMLAGEGVKYLAVAYMSEAVGLRKSGIKSPILVLFDRENPADYFKYGLTPVIYDVGAAKAFSREADAREKPIGVHIKVDTGMGRLGLNGMDAVEKITSVARMNFISITGLMSHFSDADLSDRTYAMMQIKKFKAIRDELIKKGINPGLCHMANSAAALSLPEAHFDAIRPGLMIYGYSPFTPTADSYQLSSKLKPAMTVKTKILALRRVKKGTSISYGRTFITRRDSIIGVLPVGYADGYFRAFSNNADVLVRGRRVPVAGRVCMDTIMIDATDVNGVSEGDEAVLLGSQKKGMISATELAARAGTIPYEILTSFGNKSRKVYA